MPDYNGGFLSDKDATNIRYTAPQTTQTTKEQSKMTSMTFSELTQMPLKAATLVEDLRSKNFDCHYETNIGLSNLKNVQNRENINSMKTKVSRYAKDMAAGDTFPPIIITLDRYIVDGNTRKMAAELAGDTTTNAVVFEVVYENCDDTVKAKINNLGYWRNRINGQINGIADRRKAMEATTAATEFSSSGRLANIFHTSLSFAASIIKETKAVARCKELGIVIPPGMSRKVLAVFETKSAPLSDEVRIAAVKYAAEAMLTLSEAKALFAKMKTRTLDINKIEVITEERAKSNTGWSA